MLLQIPAVRHLAEQNNFYRAEIQNGLDVSVLAQNRESSMTALSQGEQNRFQNATSRYQPMIKEEGVQNIMNRLRETLVSRYEESPAGLTKENGETIHLPLKWDAFQALKLSSSERDEAMHAYAQNKDHSAWRYLSKPNPWMHPNASYVYYEAGLGRWSTFDEYEPLISLFYLATIDTESLPIEGYTLETRLEGFIAELALIGRAHNWDRTRSGKQGMEEYDDLEGDRPSCYSGVKRRLFQSVRGHALFTILTPEVLNVEMNEYVRKHVADELNKLSDENRKSIKAILDTMIEDGDGPEPDKLAQLTALNIPLESQAQFIQHLNSKYDSSFTADFSLKASVKSSFSLNEGETHVVKFYPVLENLFVVPPTAKTITSSQNQSHLFSAKKALEQGGGASKDDEPEAPGHAP